MINVLFPREWTKEEQARMVTNFERVKVFMASMEQDIPRDPTWPGFDVEDLRIKLIREELAELENAVAHRDMIGVADALADLLYVVYGAGAAFGLPLDAIFREVHRSNMTKLNAQGQPIKDATGKVQKGPNYRPPNLTPILYPA